MFWKILFFIYLFAIILLSSMQTSYIAQKDISTIYYEFFGLTYVIFGIVLPLVYFYAMGWGKQLISPFYNKYLLKFGLILTLIFVIFLYIQEHSYLYNNMLTYAMREGMVPRNPDFQALLWITRLEILVSALTGIFMVFVPFYFGYYFYTKKMNNFEPIKYSGRKIFASYILLSGTVAAVMSMFVFIENYVNCNIFDILSITTTLYMIFGVCGYAFAKKFWYQEFWRLTLPFFIVMTFLPSSFNSAVFQKLTHMPVFHDEPISFIANVVVSLGAMYLIYKYSCTDEVYQKN